MTRQDGHMVSQATLLRDGELVLPSEYQEQRKELAKDRKAAFAVTPTRPVRPRCGSWNSASSRPRPGGAWRIRQAPVLIFQGGATIPTSPTAKMYGAITAIELAPTG